MSSRSIRSQWDVCRLCNYRITRQLVNKLSFRPGPFITARAFSTGQKTYSITSQIPRDQAGRTIAQPVLSTIDTGVKPSDSMRLTKAELRKSLQEVEDVWNALITSAKLPTPMSTKSALVSCLDLSKFLVYESQASHTTKTGATSALLSLDCSEVDRRDIYKTPFDVQCMIESLSDLATAIMMHPNVFISPSILELYVALQASLGKPETLPEIFRLYATKAIPLADTFPVRFRKQNPNDVASAIPENVVEKALQAAIAARQLVIAIDIIELSYRTKASYKARFIKNALLPTSVAAIAPLATYIFASQFGNWQTTVETHVATNTAFTGMMAYIGFTGFTGVLAVTTANDQMERVTWAPGVALRERWFREPERAAIDKVACAWGFRQRWRRGEEEGEDWDLLKEWIGRRGMMLDRVELMDGME